MALLIRPLLVLLTFVVVVVLLLTLIFGGFGGEGGAEQGGVSAGGNAKQEPSDKPSKGNVTAGGLKVGDCISDANSRTGDVTTFEAVDCDEPHDGEVYTLIKLKGGENAKPPAEAFINGKGQRGCRARLRRQATPRAFKDRQLRFKFVYPTPASWAEGDRDITCVATYKKPRSTKLAQRS
ncbi:MAG: septum formation family protein [Actinomycetota bacterium]|nr:septum formation family protein [Actinomycetota bacterium]